MDINLQSSEIDELNKIRDGLSYSVGKPDVSITELMSNKFILENTDFDTWQNLLGAAGVKEEIDLEKPRFNEFIKSYTRFDDWEEMLIHSSNEYASRMEGNEL